MAGHPLHRFPDAAETLGNIVIPAAAARRRQGDAGGRDAKSGAGDQRDGQRVTRQLPPNVEQLVTTAIELTGDHSEIIPHDLDVPLELCGGLGRGPVVLHASRSFVHLTFSLSARRVLTSGSRTRRCQLTTPTSAAIARVRPLTARPAAQAGITSDRARAPDTSKRFAVRSAATAAMPSPPATPASRRRSPTSSLFASSNCFFTSVSTSDAIRLNRSAVAS